MAVGPIESGTIKSVPGYGSEELRGEVLNGADWFRKTVQGVELDFRCVLKCVSTLGNDGDQVSGDRPPNGEVFD